MHPPDCRAGEDLSVICRCPRCEHTRDAERHESAARRLRASGEDRRARLEALRAAAARVASGRAAGEFVPTGT
ncbi:MAG TPA: hypothetical protein VNR66_16825 [Solirubrobacteraceae bacterium]|jgi:hypothetical protein|nr:hypothetical protein [Solirubrobacteraceae bacterium]